MKTYFYLFIVIFSFSFSKTNAQVKHDLKVDLLGIFGETFTASYETVLKKRIGVDLRPGLNFTAYSINEFTQTSFETHEFSATRFNLDLILKYYLLFNRNEGDGLYIGPQIGYTYLVNREVGYVEKWEEIHGLELSGGIIKNSGPLFLLYGINTGYKHIFKEHFIISFGVSFMLDKALYLEEGEEDVSGALNIGAQFMFGYRF